MINAPIGILDSGFGGLSVYQSITTLLPRESTIYIGDHAHIPYSEKTPEHIHARVSILMTHLLSKNVKLIVVACNTATVAGIDIYRKSFPGVPIIGVVPVIKTAAEISRKKSFIVLSTNFTAASAYQKNLIQSFASDCIVYNIGGHNLVDLVEQGIVEGPRIMESLHEILPPSLIKDIDVIALGCTHYPFLEKTIRAIVGDAIKILDSGGAVARQTQRILAHNSITAENQIPSHEFYSTKNDPHLSEVASQLLKQPIEVHYANI